MRYGFAHRGGAPGPDNTLASFAAALAAGARGLESDAWVTRDGLVVLDHDGLGPHPDRRRIRDLERSELPGHIPTLDELYAACGVDFDLAIDVKAPEIAEAVVRVAQQYAATSRLWVVTPDPAYVTGLGAGHRAVTIRGNVLRSRRRRAAFAAARRAGAEAVNARWPWWTRAIVDEAHALGMRAFGYDAQRRASLDHALRLGLDGVFSDHVTTMLAAIEAADRRESSGA
ncbi:MAG TPA: glycerophosphodiester phosphodiesterase [Mycobacteriales bacterium]|nr:glycerophosphodiester phosphodiesterase [Mycobacteriales bacterium]